MNNLDIALQYAKSGWQLFPAIWAKRKGYEEETHIPLCSWSMESSDSEEQIRKWAKRQDVYFCVNLKASGLNVIDIDVKKGKKGDESLMDLQLEYGGLPETLMVETPSGGTHYYYNGGFRKQTSDFLSRGIDTPTMVPLPGSTVNGKGVYRVEGVNEVAQLPEWIGGLLGVRGAEGSVGESGGYSGISEAGEENSDGGKGGKGADREDVRIEIDSAGAVADGVSYLLGEEGSVLGDGSDAAVFKVACVLKDMGLSEGVALDLMIRFYNDRCSPPHDGFWLREKVQNAFSYGESPVGIARAEGDFDRVLVDRQIGTAIMHTQEYERLDIKKRRELLSPWITEESIALCSAHRGLGKSWFSMYTAGAIASGGSFGPWSCPIEGGVPVLYLEGEMASRDIQDRLRMVGTHKNFYIYSDAYASTLGLPKANVGNSNWRDQMKKYMLDTGIKFWVMDNIYSLSTGFDVNSDKDWSPVNEWIIDLKFSGISTLMVHHVGKGGSQLGTSTREANIDVSIMLKQPKDYEIDEGARFLCEFNKTRSIEHKDLPKVKTRQFWLKPTDDGKLEWEIASKKKETLSKVLRLKDNGVSNADIAEMINSSRQNIGQLIKRAKEKELLNKDGKLTDKGVKMVLINTGFEEENL